MSNLDNFIPESTADGSFTFFSKEFGELFHSHYGARQESFFKYSVPTRLATAAKKSKLRLLDVCYGLGYNTAAALQTIWEVNPNCYVEVIGLELNPAVSQAAITHQLYNSWDYKYSQILAQLAFEHQVLQDRIQANLLVGDARSTIQLVHKSNFKADAIFLDPFSPPHCPQLWTIEFIQQLALCLDLNGLLATYSCAAAVRTAFLSAGLQIGSTAPIGRRAPGTVATHARREEDGEINFYSHPLSQAEKEHLLTRAAIPYRDPQLNDSAEIILRRRQQEQQASSLEPTSVWRKRWISRSQLEIV
ncbi:MnmC family methyltransferase [Scytonema sp. NUACC21]